MELQERMVRQKKNEPLAHGASGTKDTYIALALGYVILVGGLHAVPHFFLGYEGAILSISEDKPSFSQVSISINVSIKTRQSKGVSICISNRGRDHEDPMSQDLSSAPHTGYAALECQFPHRS